MIKIPRRRKENGKIIKPDADWSRKAKAKTREAIKEGPAHQVSDLYRNKNLKAALEKLFYDKCAYCESPLTAGDWDVEHYRPKGRVAERPDHPGYYWLAYKWENLYPSCIYCNQRRKDQPRYDDPRTLPAKGKLDQFPIENEKHRAMKPGDHLTKESPLLLNPCRDDPEKFLTYDRYGQVMPLSEKDQKAVETIRICHLKRRRLRDERARVIIRVGKIMATINKAKSTGNREILKELKELLELFTAPSSPFAATARNVKKKPDTFL